MTAFKQIKTAIGYYIVNKQLKKARLDKEKLDIELADVLSEKTDNQTEQLSWVCVLAIKTQRRIQTRINKLTLKRDYYRNIINQG